MKTSIFADALESTTRLIGRRNVRTVFTGTEAKTDGDTVFMPALPSGATLTEEQCERQRGYRDHEAMHVRCTDTSKPMLARLGRMTQASPMLGAITQYCEDVRIEHAGVTEYGGMQRTLSALAEAVGQELLGNIEAMAQQLGVKPEDVIARATPDVQLQVLMSTMGRDLIGVKSKTFKRLAEACDPRFRAFAEKWAPAMAALPTGVDDKGVLDEEWSKQGTAKAFALAERIYKDWQKLDKTPPPPPAPPEPPKPEPKPKAPPPPPPPAPEPEPEPTPEPEQPEEEEQEPAADEPEADEDQDQDNDEPEQDQADADDQADDQSGDDEDEDDTPDDGDGGDDADPEDYDAPDMEAQASGGEGDEGDDDGEGSEGSPSDSEGGEAGGNGGGDSEPSEVDGEHEGGGGEGQGGGDQHGSGHSDSTGIAQQQLPAEWMELDMATAADAINTMVKELNEQAGGAELRPKGEGPVVPWTRAANAQAVIDITEAMQHSPMQVKWNNERYLKLRDEVRDRAAMIRRALELELQARWDRVWQPGHRSGRLNASKLVDAVSGRENVFRKREDGKDMDTLLVLSIDGSSSMLDPVVLPDNSSRTRMHTAVRLAFAMTQALESTGADIQVEVWGSHTYGNGDWRNRGVVGGVNTPQLASDAAARFTTMQGGRQPSINKARDAYIEWKAAGNSDDRHSSYWNELLQRQLIADGYVYPTSSGYAATTIIKPMRRRISDPMVQAAFGWAQNAPAGGTPMIDAVDYRLDWVMQQRHSKRILCVLGDGEPDRNYELSHRTGERHIKRLCKLAREEGIHMLGVGIDTGMMSKFFDDHVTVDGKEAYDVVMRKVARIISEERGVRR